MKTLNQAIETTGEDLPVKNDTRARVLVLTSDGEIPEDEWLRADSDADMVVDFAPDSEWGMFDSFDMRDELKKYIDCGIDPVEFEGAINPTRRHRIKQTMKVAHEYRTAKS